MRLIEKGGPYGDQTCLYEVTDYKAITVEDFIREALESEPYEWGEFEVVNDKLPFNPRYKYWLGKFSFTQLHNDICDATVMKVTAHGGWSYMDYKIYTSIV